MRVLTTKEDIQISVVKKGYKVIEAGTYIFISFDNLSLEDLISIEESFIKNQINRFEFQVALSEEYEIPVGASFTNEWCTLITISHNLKEGWKDFNFYCDKYKYPFAIRITKDTSEFEFKTPEKDTIFNNLDTTH